MTPLDPEECGHNGQITLDWEGWEDQTEPLQIVITCGDCEGHLRIVIEDVALLKWERES